MTEKSSKKYISYCLTGIGLLILLFLQFLLHRATPFMRDDFWYSTNLVTGEPISGISDIIQSQIWHYFNWGGRVINHGLLQAVLASGELWADIFNCLATIILGLVISLFVKKKSPCIFLLIESLIIAFNASIFYSMYWQSGSVNYLYSTSWILLYVFLVIRELEETAPQKMRGIELWILPLSLITGWSTENMGPSCFVLTLAAILYLKKKKRPVPVWLFEGAVLTLTGSSILILAPGNFVSNQFMGNEPLFRSMILRARTILESTFSYLFPSLLFALILLAAEITVFKKTLSASRFFLFGLAILAQCVMILSPTYPQRASFGIMCVLIAFIVSSVEKLYENNEKNHIPIFILVISFCLYAVLVVIRDLIFPYY